MKRVITQDATKKDYSIKVQPILSVALDAKKIKIGKNTGRKELIIYVLNINNNPKVEHVVNTVVVQDGRKPPEMNINNVSQNWGEFSEDIEALFEIPAYREWLEGVE